MKNENSRFSRVALVASFASGSRFRHHKFLASPITAFRLVQQNHHVDWPDRSYHSRLLLHLDPSKRQFSGSIKTKTHFL